MMKNGNLPALTAAVLSFASANFTASASERYAVRESGQGMSENSSRFAQASGQKVESERFLKDYSIANGNPITENLSRFALTLGKVLTNYDSAEANSNKYNQASNITNEKGEVVGVKNINIFKAIQGGLTLEQAQAKYGDYGYFQLNSLDVGHAVNLGVPIEKAAALNNAAGKGNYTLREQAEAVALYIDKFNPQAAYAISLGDFEKASKLLKGKWSTLFTTPVGAEFSDTKVEKK